MHVLKRSLHSELLVLERELQEIDQIERDLSALTHERQLLTDGIQALTCIDIDYISNTCSTRTNILF